MNNGLRPNLKKTKLGHEDRNKSKLGQEQAAIAGFGYVRRRLS